MFKLRKLNFTAADFLKFISSYFIFLATFSSCVKKNYHPSESILYKHDFMNGNGGWETPLIRRNINEINLNDTIGNPVYLVGDTISVTSLVPVKGGYADISSPYFFDTNHSFPGAGNLTLLSWVYLNGFRKAISTVGIYSLDLRNCFLKITLNISKLELNGSNLLFWFQTKLNDGRYANYALIGQPINNKINDTTDTFHDVVIELPSLESNGWKCLGASNRDSYRYGCALNFDSAISRVDFDFGFIIFPVEKDFYSGKGSSLKIKSIKLYK